MNRETCKSVASNYWLCHAKHPSSADFPSSDERFKDRIPWVGNIDQTHCQGQSPDEVNSFGGDPHPTTSRHRMSGLRTESVL